VSNVVRLDTGPHCDAHLHQTEERLNVTDIQFFFSMFALAAAGEVETSEGHY
jgi:hypothetical protein